MKRVINGCQGCSSMTGDGVCMHCKDTVYYCNYCNDEFSEEDVKDLGNDKHICWTCFYDYVENHLQEFIDYVNLDDVVQEAWED